MNLRYPLFVLFAVLAVVTEGRTQTFWQGTTYGMSVEQVQKIVPTAHPSNDKRDRLGDGAQGLLRIDEEQIAYQHFAVNFYFLAGKLEQVTLTLKYPGEWETAMIAFNTLVEHLRAKYKHEVSDQSAANSIHRERLARWASGRTNISIYASAVSGFSAMLNVNYQLRPAHDSQARAAHQADKL